MLEVIYILNVCQECKLASALVDGSGGIHTVFGTRIGYKICASSYLRGFNARSEHPQYRYVCIDTIYISV